MRKAKKDILLVGSKISNEFVVYVVEGTQKLIQLLLMLYKKEREREFYLSTGEGEESIQREEEGNSPFNSSCHGFDWCS